MINLIAKLHARVAQRDRGATAVEYGLIVALIAAVIVVAVLALGGNLSDMFDDVADCIENTTTC